MNDGDIVNIKEGDIIVCINNGHENDTISKPMLTLNKSYVVIDVYRCQSTVFIKVSNDVGIVFGYFYFRFRSLVEYRKMKLKRLSFMSE